MGSNKLHILVALSNIDEDIAKELVFKLKKLGVPITNYGLKFRKSTIEDYVNEHHDTDVLLVSEMLEIHNGYTHHDFERLVENHPSLCIIPVLMDTQKGKPYMKEIFNLGIYNAIYNADASLEQVAKIINKNRSRKEARYYYDLNNMDSTIVQEDGADINICLRTIARAKDKVSAVHHILERVTEDEFSMILSKLPNETLSILKTSNDKLLIPYLQVAESKNVNKIGGLLRKFTGKKDTISRVADVSLGNTPKTEQEDNIAIQLDEENFVVDVSDIFPQQDAKPVEKEVIVEEILEVEPVSEISMGNSFELDGADEVIGVAENPNKSNFKVKRTAPYKNREMLSLEVESRGNEIELSGENNDVEFTGVVPKQEDYIVRENEQKRVVTQEKRTRRVSQDAGKGQDQTTQKKITSTYYSNTSFNSNLIVETLIGVVGLKSGVGVTFQAILLARYFASKGKKVALVENGGSSVFSVIESCYPVNKYNESTFIYKGITFYKKSKSAITEVYDVIVTDYGCYRDEIKEQCMNSLDLFIVSGGLAWENVGLANILNELLENRKCNVFARNTYALFRGTLDKDMKLPYNYIVLPTITNPFVDQLCDEVVAAVEGNPIVKENREVNNERDLPTHMVESSVDPAISTSGQAKGFGSLLGLKKFARDIKVSSDSKELYSAANERVQRGKHNDMGGICSVFVTSLRAGCGVTHVSETLASYMTVRGKTALISRESNCTQEFLKGVTTYTTSNISEVPEVFAMHSNVVMDAGIYTELSTDTLLECRRSLVKVMVCWGNSSYLENLAAFIEKEGEEAENWIYVFNNVPDTQIRSIKKLMNFYTCCFMPVYAIGDMSGTVKTICKEILNI